MVLFTAVVSGKKFSLDLVFDWQSVRGDTTLGWTLGLVWLLNSIAGLVLRARLDKGSPTLRDLSYLDISL